ncbi:MAG: anion permease [Thermoplasmata archaeon]|nr:anion permease [Thermoplasmata archaeon]
MLVLFVFIFVAILWLTRPFWHLIGFSNLQNLLDDSIIALIGAVLLFIIPIDFKKWQSALALEDIQEIPFGILILFGGGLCLGKGLFESGAAQWLAEKVPTGNVLLLLLLVIIITSFLTEVASNTAIANMMLPILIAIANNAEINPYYLLIPATLSCSLAFMFPISTPPNAIVFSSDYIKMHDMVKAGTILHIIGLVIIFIMGQFLFKLI